MEYTKLTNLEVTGELKADGEVKAAALAGVLKGVVLTKSANYSLTNAEKVAYVGMTMSSASKTLTLGLPYNAVCIVVNEGGTNAFTLKNVAGDSGTSLAAGKVALVRASATANGSKVYVLN